MAFAFASSANSSWPWRRRTSHMHALYERGMANGLTGLREVTEAEIRDTSRPQQGSRACMYLRQQSSTSRRWRLSLERRWAEWEAAGVVDRALVGLDETGRIGA